ncbi:unnamed protein product [Ectocarpus sp. 12 AP-2014]
MTADSKEEQLRVALTNLGQDSRCKRAIDFLVAEPARVWTADFSKFRDRFSQIFKRLDELTEFVMHKFRCFKFELQSHIFSK